MEWGEGKGGQDILIGAGTARLVAIASEPLGHPLQCCMCVCVVCVYVCVCVWYVCVWASGDGGQEGEDHRVCLGTDDSDLWWEVPVDFIDIALKRKHVLS